MSRANSAVLLSALVFPGAGQVFLGHRLRGLLFIVPALAAALYFFGEVYARAQAIVDALSTGSMALDPVRILGRIHEQGQDASLGAELAGAVMVGCWVVSIIDAWYLGRGSPQKK